MSNVRLYRKERRAIRRIVSVLRKEYADLIVGDLHFEQALNFCVEQSFSLPDAELKILRGYVFNVNRRLAYFTAARKSSR